jgi:glutathione S-transferase
VTIKLFDLAGAEPDRRFSPYCWRTKLALAHKGLTVETIPWRFSDTDAIEVSGQGRVPVLLDGDKVVSDSWTIAEYLEDTYQHPPSLFGSAEARA